MKIVRWFKLINSSNHLTIFLVEFRRKVLKENFEVMWTEVMYPKKTNNHEYKHSWRKRRDLAIALNRMLSVIYFALAFSPDSRQSNVTLEVLDSQSLHSFPRTRWKINSQDKLSLSRRKDLRWWNRGIRSEEVQKDRWLCFFRSTSALDFLSLSLSLFLFLIRTPGSISHCLSHCLYHLIVLSASLIHFYILDAVSAFLVSSAAQCHSLTLKVKSLPDSLSTLYSSLYRSTLNHIACENRSMKIDQEFRIYESIVTS